MNSPNRLADLIKEKALAEGELLIGFARLEEAQKGLDHEILKLVSGLEFAISLGFPLNFEVLQTISDRPTILYKHHYQQANYLLDRVSLHIAQILEQEGYRALPIPASIYTSREEKRAHLNHREVAFQAGLGWWGKCNLIIHPHFGAGIRLATVLTNFPFDSATPKSRTTPNGCNECRACLEACPAQAISQDISEFNHSACFAQIREFEKKVIGVGICGICVRACREAREKASKSSP